MSRLSGSVTGGMRSGVYYFRTPLALNRPQLRGGRQRRSSTLAGHERGPLMDPHGRGTCAWGLVGAGQAPGRPGYVLGVPLGPGSRVSTPYRAGYPIVCEPHQTTSVTNAMTTVQRYLGSLGRAGWKITPIRQHNSIGARARAGIATSSGPM